MEKISDLYLADKVKNGDMTAFEMLVNRHKDFAYHIAIRVVKIPEDAEEIAHDAFIKLLNKIGSFKGDAKFTSWFYRLVINLAIAKTRKNKLMTDDLTLGKMGEHGISDYETSDHMHKEDQKVMLELAISELNEEERVLITLYYYEELSLDEMQELTGFEKNFMKVKIFRARKMLAKSLKFLLAGEETRIY